MWRNEPTDVEKSADELWVGVKCQSNQELAGSPRNAFRHSVRNILQEVEHWFCAGGEMLYQTMSNSECLQSKYLAVRL